MQTHIIIKDVRKFFIPTNISEKPFLVGELPRTTLHLQVNSNKLSFETEC